MKMVIMMNHQFDDALDDSFETCHVGVRDVKAGSGLRILLDFTQDHPQSHLVATLVP